MKEELLKLFEQIMVTSNIAKLDILLFQHVKYLESLILTEDNL